MNFFCKEFIIMSCFFLLWFWSDTMNSEDTRSVDMSLQNIEERGFYTETFHSASWIYRGDDANANETMKCLSNRPRPVAGEHKQVINH